MAPTNYFFLDNLGLISALMFGDDTPEGYVIDVLSSESLLYTIDRNSKIMSEGTLYEGNAYLLVVRHSTTMDVLHSQVVAL